MIILTKVNKGEQLKLHNIYFHDLNEAAQASVLKFYALRSTKDGNFKQPLVVLENWKEA